MKPKTRTAYRISRHRRVRRKVKGTAACPRMAIMRSNQHLYAQLIDDDAEHTLVYVSSMQVGVTKNVEGAAVIGKRVAELAKDKGITQFVVDRGGFRYHGRVKAIVDAACESGLSNTKEAK
jgi:large subunit ribosomal protein L18